MRISGTARLLAVAATAALLPLAPGSPAQAFVTKVEVRPTTIVAVAGGDASIAATLPLGVMRGGEARNVRAEVVLGNPASDSESNAVAAGQKITCEYADGRALPRDRAEIWNTRNLWEEDGDVTLMARMLFIAPEAGSYRCHLRMYLLEGYGKGRESAAMRSGYLGDIDGPLYGHTAQLTGSRADDVFLGLGAPFRQLHHVYGYTPEPNATSFRLVGELGVTSCYGDGGNACPKGVYGSRERAAQVYSRVVATPSILGNGCGSQASTPSTVKVTGRTHHFRISHEIAVKLPATGCGTWTLNLVARDNGGTLPFVVHTGSGPYTVIYARPS